MFLGFLRQKLKVRLELNTPVVKGRIVMPSIEVRPQSIEGMESVGRRSLIFCSLSAINRSIPGYSLA